MPRGSASSNCPPAETTTRVVPRTLWILIRVSLDADFSVFFRIPAAGSRVLEIEQQLLVQQGVGDYVDYHNAGTLDIDAHVPLDAALDRGRPEAVCRHHRGG